MGLLDLIRSPKTELVRSTPMSLAFDQWAGLISSFSFNGANYTLPGATQEDIGSSYSGVARGGMKGNGVVFACMAARVDLFSEARFMYRRTRSGRPGDLFSFRDDDLGILRQPWQGGTTGDLLSRMEQHAGIGGNSYVVRVDNMLTPLRPDWVSIIAGVPNDPDATIWHPAARVLGYMYQEGGAAYGKEPVFFLPEQVAHYAPIPDPEARFRGMSWMTPVIREIMADKAMTDHRLAFFENGATPNLAVKLDTDDLDKYRAFVKEFDSNHAGAMNAYKTMWLAAGADVTPVGTDLRQLDFKITQGAGETRVAAAAGIHPVIVGLSEGLQGSSLNAGNFGAARRLTADRTLRPLWRNVCGSLANVIRVPSDGELWYDARDISFLQEDEKDAADIFAVDAQSFRTLVDGGVEPDSAKAAVAARDISLVSHSGLLSVQLQEPGAPQPAEQPQLPPADEPKRELDPFDMLSKYLSERRDEQPINVNVNTPDVHVDVQPAAVTVEPAHVTVEPARIEEGAVVVNLEAPAPPDVHVQVEAPNVTIERSKARRVDFGDGRSATVTEGDVKRIEYDDGREVTITEVDE